MKICLFDIDGTLIRSCGAGKQAFLHTLEQAFDINPIDPGIPFAGRTDRGIVQDLFCHFDIPVTAESWQRFTEIYLSLLPACLTRCGGHVLPGVEILLEKMGENPVVGVGLLTGNTARGAEIKLQHFGLADYFRFGGFGDEYVDRDRVAEQALLATRQSCGNEIAADQVFVIGDTPADIRCGRSIGAQTVAVCTGNYSAGELADEAADLVFDDLLGAQPLLDLLTA